MERIYTIPVNEKFEESAKDASNGCPFCALFRMLEENELEIILGASMMDPDIRIKTNEVGFCPVHYDMMYARGNHLGLALMLESHFAEQRRALEVSGLSAIIKNPSDKAVDSLTKLERSCYVCGKINYHFKRMVETAALLYDTEEQFREKAAAQPYFCLPHYRDFLVEAKRRMNKKNFAQFYKVISALELDYYDTISADVSWYCKKFDYRYGDEPRYNSKDAVPRAIKFLSGDIHRINKK